MPILKQPNVQAQLRLSDDEIDFYLPYLIALASENSEFLPEAILYHLTDEVEFRNDLLEKQISDQYWNYNDDKFFGTALALIPLNSDSGIPARENAIDWLFEVQNDDGCWDNGNIENTAFILASISSGRNSGGGGSSDLDCVDEGYSCSSGLACRESGGTTLSGYSCSGVQVCCSVKKEIKTCNEQGGSVCNSQESCIGGSDVDASDLKSGELCCIRGSCQIPSENENTCESSGGTCRVTGCNEGEEVLNSLECEISGDYCCVQSEDSDGGISWWVWVLIVLIILMIIGIIFRDRSRILFLRFGSSSRSGPQNNNPRFPPSSSIPMRMTPRQIIPGTSAPSRTMPQRVQNKSEIDEVLKKLKGISS